MPSGHGFKVNTTTRRMLHEEDAAEDNADFFADRKGRGLQDCSGMGTTWGPGIGPPPTGCDATGGGGGGGGVPREAMGT
jgi:hypothetical protein